MLLLFTFIYLLTVTSSTESAKILAVFPTPSISHQVVFRPVVKELAKRGHEVVVITTDPVYPHGEAPQNLTEIDLHDLSYTMWKKFMETDKGKESDSLNQIAFIFELIANIFEAQVKSSAVQKLINDKKRNFDLVFVETCVRPALSFSYLYQVPVIEFSSLGGLYGTYESTGAMSNHLVYPIAVRQKIHNLSVWEKIWELYNYYKSDFSYRGLETFENKMLKRLFGPKIPDLDELRKNVHMTFLNIHPIWDFNRPVPPNVVYLGGLHQNPVKELPKDLKNYLDASTNGVIYMSFGTNVKPSLLPPEKIQLFIKVFSQLPYNVLWKWDKAELPGRSTNIKISKWFPQSDLLKHPNIKVFITQGGLQSTDEAVTAGVPLIGVPMLGDQWFNSEQYVIHKIGVKLSIETLTEDVLKDAIEAVIKDKSYRQNMIKLRGIMRDNPQTSVERAVWWTEYVLRHSGAKHLRTPAADMTWTEYYGIDIVLVLIALTSVPVLGLVLLVRLVKAKWQVKVKMN